MDLSLTEDQEMMKKVASDFVRAEVPAHQMTQWYKDKRTFQPQLVKKAAEMGWLGMMLPEEHGGAGVSVDGLRRGFRGAWTWPGAGTTFHIRYSQRADDFRSVHGRAKKIVVAGDLQRRIDRRAGNHR